MSGKRLKPLSFVTSPKSEICLNSAKIRTSQHSLTLFSH